MELNEENLFKVNKTSKKLKKKHSPGEKKEKHSSTCDDLMIFLSSSYLSFPFPLSLPRTYFSISISSEANRDYLSCYLSILLLSSSYSCIHSNSLFLSICHHHQHLFIFDDKLIPDMESIFITHISSISCSRNNIKSMIMVKIMV